ncbi:MAG: hypothetical protein C5B49_07755 [Bdellovibrio sp.]|nr:MAG: hypothetical protein C5B49_07755 [Bdellovibrio sp.]
MSVVQVRVRAWDVDLSRRRDDLQKLKGDGPSSFPSSSSGSSSLAGQTPGSSAGGPSRSPASDSAKDGLVSSGIFSSLEPTQEIVILNTQDGFVPEILRLKKGQNYRIHVVNVNEKEKNVSFILDAFSQHEGTYFGQPKSFEISPKIEGIFSFQCPETAKQGKILVSPTDADRKPASE